jgi:hypothetical protein
VEKFRIEQDFWGDFSAQCRERNTINDFAGEIFTGIQI